MRTRLKNGRFRGRLLNCVGMSLEAGLVTTGEVSVHGTATGNTVVDSLQLFDNNL